jgi:hypothetical protein
LELCRGEAGGGGDSLVEEIVGELPCAGVAVALGRTQAKGCFDEFATVELGLGLGLGLGPRLDLGLWGVVGEECGADATGDGDHAGGIWRDIFDGGEVEVEGGGGGGRGVFACTGGLVPLVGIDVVIGVVGALVVVGAGGEGPDADDAALDGAAEAVGVGEQRGLRRWSGLYLRGPQAGGDPEGSYGEDGEAEGSAQSEEGERCEGEDGEEEEYGGARGWRREFGEGLAEGEAERGGKQWGPAQAEGLDAWEAGPEAALEFVL